MWPVRAIFIWDSGFCPGFPAVFMVNNQLHDLIGECVSRRGASLIDFVQRGHAGTLHLEAFVDNEAGITTELCAGISREINLLIVEKGLVNGAYQLTVSSPGIDRSLKFPWQFKKHAGRELKIRWRADGNVLETVGKLLSVDGVALVLSVKSSQGDVRIEFGSIEAAKVKVPW